ncbi:MAG TPA: helix-turn-helix transcriptional regulator [Vicinamibacteria bacterium]|nr:helix-turn-helix transcriptional regulator [Vicinamibacteria bacterium]
MSSADVTPRVPALHARIRRRRAQIGVTGTELAQRAGISTSYVSVIESGAKVPDETVAAALARALGDDEALYRAWARAARLRVHDLELLNGLATIAATPALVRMIEGGEPLPAADGEFARRLREVAFRLGPAPAPSEAPPPAASSPAGVIAVPVLEEPGAAARRRPPEPLMLDARLLEGLDASLLVACEVSAASAARLRGVVSPGDRVVLCRGLPPRPDRVSAVRTPEGTTLCRALSSERSVILLPAEGDSEVSAVPLGDGQSLTDVVVGTQVLLIRR